MIRKKKIASNIIIDIDGPEGNAHNIMGTAVMLGRDHGYSEDRLNEMVNDMKSGDYINLLSLFNEEFGSFIVMETENEAYIEALAAWPRFRAPE